ncbi:MAG TPA: lysylphosphatidylglycerol synthase domain-containing protein [Rhizomicrobium sp.]|nr:lysylphosphatidylglycerol synthase domain-containing protein [Rhizomicrobium sp.]
MKRNGLILAAALGLATTLYLVFYVGLGAVFGAIASLGLSGFAALCVLYVVLLALLSVSWFVLVPGLQLSRWPTFFWGRAVRDSAAEVLPLSQFGGFVIGARAVALRGVAAADAYASTMVDVTTEMLAQIVFVVTGAIIFILHFGFHSQHNGLFMPLLLGPAIATLAAAGFICVQRKGPAFAEKMAERLLPQAVGHAGAFARSIGDIYAAPWRTIASTGLHLVSWLASAAIGWTAVNLIGGHVSYINMLAIESALCAIRSAAVIVPSAMGVQEASYAMLMPLFGMGPEIGVALSLLKRACNIAIGIPVLLSWQGLEGRHAVSLVTRDERLSEN